MNAFFWSFIGVGKRWPKYAFIPQWNFKRMHSILKYNSNHFFNRPSPTIHDSVHFQSVTFNDFCFCSVGIRVSQNKSKRLETYKVLYCRLILWLTQTNIQRIPMKIWVLAKLEPAQKWQSKTCYDIPLFYDVHGNTRHTM